MRSQVLYELPREASMNASISHWYACMKCIVKSMDQKAHDCQNTGDQTLRQMYRWDILWKHGFAHGAALYDSSFV